MNIEILNEEIKFPSPTGTGFNSQNIKFLDKDFYISVLRYRITDGKRKFNLYLDFNQGVIFFLALNNQTINDEKELIGKIFEGIRFSEKKINSPFGDKKIQGHKWKPGEYKNVQMALKKYFTELNKNEISTQATNQTQEKTNAENNAQTQSQSTNVQFTILKDSVLESIDDFFKAKEIIKIINGKNKIEKMKELIDLIANKTNFTKLTEFGMTRNNGFSKIYDKDEVKDSEIGKKIKNLLNEIDMSLQEKLTFWSALKKWIKEKKLSDLDLVNNFYESSEDKDFYKEIKNTEMFLEKYMGKK